MTNESNEQLKNLLFIKVSAILYLHSIKIFKSFLFEEKIMKYF